MNLENMTLADLEILIANHLVEFYILIIWTMLWTAFALWKAVKNNHKIWFILILISNTVGIFEIIYLLLDRYKVVKKQKVGALDKLVKKFR